MAGLPHDMSPRGQAAVIGVVVVAALLGLTQLPGGAPGTGNHTVLDCSGDRGCERTTINRTTADCNPWYVSSSLDGLDCNYTTSGVADVSLVTDPANHVTAPWHNASLTADIQDLGLSVPWDLEFLPDGSMLVTEQNGEVHHYRNGSRTTIGTFDVTWKETVGMMGLAVHPDFPDEPYVYLQYTTGYADDELDRNTNDQSEYYVWNRISRFRFTDGTLQDETVLADRILGTVYHSGGRLEFGPDGMLYATTGDGGFPVDSQEIDFLSGKVLRMAPDGSVPDDNPFPGSLVYSSGHRNPQGLAWNPGTGGLWSTEHGDWRHDELNRIEPGANYGWGALTCDDVAKPHIRRRGETVEPVWCTTEWTLAPSGMVFVDEPGHPWHGDLFVTSLRGKHLHRFTIEDTALVDNGIFWVNTGDRMSQRIRDVEFRDGDLWALGDYGGVARLSPGAEE